VSHDRLTLVPKNNTKPAPSKKKIHVVAEKKEALHTLDFRGMRAEEALTELEKFLDDALLSGVRSFSILHGKGYGILRTVIRKHLNQYKDMLEYKDAALEFGGEGITEVKFV
jgi:dsDNA-specific endonuclease/ATPase MutS2